MNDDFDARLYYDGKKIREWLEAIKTDNEGFNSILAVIGMEELPEKIKEIPEMENLFAYVKKIPIEQLVSRYDLIINYVLDNVDSELNNIVHQVQQLTKIACFSETYQSDMMWGQYSGNATGFVLEYEFDRQTYSYSRSDSGVPTVVWASLYPMIYDNNRLDTTNYVWFLFRWRLLTTMANVSGMDFLARWFDTVLPCPDEFMVTKLALKKSREWKAEKEWRMIWSTNNPYWTGEIFSYVIHKPSAVYLGRKISKINEKILIDVAKEKSIPAYKMDFNNSSRDYQLQGYQIL